MKIAWEKDGDNLIGRGSRWNYHISKIDEGDRVVWFISRHGETPLPSWAIGECVDLAESKRWCAEVDRGGPRVIRWGNLNRARQGMPVKREEIGATVSSERTQKIRKRLAASGLY